MSNVLTDLQAAGWSSARVNQSFADLQHTLLDPSTEFGGAGSALQGSGWSAPLAANTVSSIFPPPSAVEIYSAFERSAAGGMVPAVPDVVATPSLAPRRSTDHLPGLFPWSVLADPAAVAVMADALPGLLGIDGIGPSAADDVLLRLGTTRGAPTRMLAGAPGLDTLADLVGRVHPAIGKQGNDPGDPKTGGGKPPVLSSEAIALLKMIIEGLRSAQFHTFWWGYRVTLGPGFCTAFPKAVEGVEGGLLLKALVAALGANGFWAALGAAAAAIGGWVTVGVVLYAAYLALAVALNATPRGAYMFGAWATVIPLWVQGI